MVVDLMPRTPPHGASESGFLAVADDVLRCREVSKLLMSSGLSGLSLTDELLFFFLFR